MKLWGWIVALALLWIAASADMSVGAAGAPMWAPRLVLGLSLALALICRPSVAACWGFIGGWVAGALAGASLPHLILPHVLVTFLVAHARQLQPELSVWSGGLWIWVGGWAIQSLYILLVGSSQMGLALLLAPVSSLLTAVLAIPVYAVLSRSAAAQGP
jgi:hypothetical protein